MARNHRIVAVGSENLHLMVDSASNHPSPLRISPRPRWGLLDGNVTAGYGARHRSAAIYRIDHPIIDEGDGEARSSREWGAPLAAESEKRKEFERQC